MLPETGHVPPMSGIRWWLDHGVRRDNSEGSEVYVGIPSTGQWLGYCFSVTWLVGAILQSVQKELTPDVFSWFFSEAVDCFALFYTQIALKWSQKFYYHLFLQMARRFNVFDKARFIENLHKKIGILSFRLTGSFLRFASACGGSCWCGCWSIPWPTVSILWSARSDCCLRWSTWDWQAERDFRLAGIVWWDRFKFI